MIQHIPPKDTSKGALAEQDVPFARRHNGGPGDSIGRFVYWEVSTGILKATLEGPQGSRRVPGLHADRGPWPRRVRIAGLACGCRHREVKTT